MGDIGLFSQGWRWFEFQKQAFVGTQIAVGCTRDRLVFLVDRHWPVVSRWSMNLGNFLLKLIWLWRDCIVRGFATLISLCSTAVFVIIWSCFLSLASTVCLLYMLLSLGTAGASIYFLGYTPGLFVVGLFGILMLWKYSNFWITGLLIIVGGYVFSLNHARVLVFISAAYSLYFAYARIGWAGIFVSINLSFISNDLLNKLLQGYDCAGEGSGFEEQKASEPLEEDYASEFEFFHQTEANNATSSKSTVKNSVTSNFLNVQKEASSSKVVKADLASIDEITRIMKSSNHYEALGFSRRNSIDPIVLKKEYHKKAMLVHPDKNMGKPLASESFKKLQCAYEVLSDFTKKKNYDEQLKKEESGVAQRSCSSSKQDGVDFHSEESRRIDCTKCGNSHIWICVKRNKSSARWCQDCSQYHQAKDGDGWVEYRLSSIFSTSQKVEIPRAFVCAESKIFDVSEWAICQGVTCKPNAHRPSFHVNMVGLDNKSPAQRSNSSRYPWGLDAEMVPEDDEFELWLQQALASGLFSDSPKRRKSWSPFKMPQKGIKPWRRSP